MRIWSTAFAQQALFRKRLFQMNSISHDSYMILFSQIYRVHVLDEHTALLLLNVDAAFAVKVAVQITRNGLTREFGNK